MHELPYAENVIGFAAAGEGIGILPRLAARGADRFSVRVLPLAFPLSRTLSLVTVSETVLLRLNTEKKPSTA